jgi:hypothetical protein
LATDEYIFSVSVLDRLVFEEVVTEMPPVVRSRSAEVDAVIVASLVIEGPVSKELISSVSVSESIVLKELGTEELMIAESIVDINVLEGYVAIGLIIVASIDDTLVLDG